MESLAPDGNPVLVSKSPFHSLHYPELIDVWTPLRILHVLRDPEDTLRSFLNFVFELSSVFSERVDPVMLGRDWLGFWRSVDGRLERFATGYGMPAILALPYDDLTRDPWTALCKVADILDLSFEEDASQYSVRTYVSSLSSRSSRPSMHNLEFFGLTSSDLQGAFKSGLLFKD